MFGLPFWAIDLIIAFLRATGFTGWASNLALKAGSKVVEEVKSLEIDPDYDIQKNGVKTPPVVSIQSWKEKGRQ